MNRSALFKRLGGAALILGIVAAALFALRPLIHFVAGEFDGAARDALFVVGRQATPDQAGNFMFFLFAALAIVFCRRCAK